MEVIYCGPVVVPYPAEVEGAVCLEEMVATHGVCVGEGGKVITTHPEGAVAYAIVVDSKDAELIKQWRKEGLEVKISTPLEGVVMAAIVARRRDKNVVLEPEGGCVAVAYAERHRLLYAETLPIAGDEEFVNLLALLTKDFDLRKAQFSLRGEEAKRYAKIVKRYFRRVEYQK